MNLSCPFGNILTCSLFFAVHPSPPDPKPTILEYQHRYELAEKSHNVAGIIKIIRESRTLDFELINVPDKAGHSRKESTSEIIAGIKRSMEYITVTEASSRVLSIRRLGNQAVVRVSSTLTAKLSSEKSPDGHSYTGKGLETSDCTWVYLKSNWKLKSVRILDKSFVKIGKT